MKLTNRVIKNDKLFGFWVEDGTEAYPIRIESLHTPMILDTLMAEGWELHALPYDLRNGADTLEDLPEMEYADLHLTETDEQDMVDMMSQRYKEVDLRSKLVKSPINYIQFSKGTNQIKTREALIKFLKNTADDDIDLDVPTAYLPLNSFVDKNILFTPEEYFSDENTEIRMMIEKRRIVSFKNFQRLVDFFIATGMKEDYSSKEFVDHYFQWGICGIKFDAFERKSDYSNLILGAPLSPSLDDNEMPYVRMRVLTCMDTSGKLKRTPNTQTGKWVPVLKELAMEEKRREISDYGFNYVAPVFIESIIDESVTTITGESLVVEYTDERMILTHNGYSYSGFTIKVRRVDDVFKMLPSQYWNIRSEEAKKELFEEFYMNAICKELLDKTTVYSDVSSYKALSTTGAGPRAIVSYMTETNKRFKEVLQDPKERNLFIVRIDEYMRGDLHVNPEVAADIETFVQDVLSGVVNVDNTAAGQDADSLRGYENVYQVIYVAHKILGVPLDEIYKQVKELHPDTPYVDFKGVEKSVRLTIEKRDEKLKGYIADTKSYRRRQAETAKEWHWVTAVYRELGKPSPSRRHVAVDLLTFYRDKKSESVENYITNIINEAISNNVPYKEQDSWKEFLPIMISGFLFEAGLKGTITLPQPLGGNVIKLADDLKESISSYFDHEVESTIGISETTIGQDGKFYRYTVNAIIMPEYVLPHKGYTMKEYPFIPMWFNSTGMDDVRMSWFRKGLIPSADYFGMINYYKDMAVLRGRLDWDNDITSLVWYYKESDKFRASFPTDKEFDTAPHPMEILYPELLDYDLEEIPYENRKDVSKIGQPHKFVIGDIVELSRESMLERFPILRALFDTKEKIPESKYGFNKFFGMTAEDFYFLKSLDKMPLSPDFSGKSKLLAVLNKSEACLDDANKDNIKYTDVEDFDPDKYAVVQMHGRKYMMEDVNGIFWEVIV